ncbi:MAG: DUF1573 domain-containing protein [Pirellulaceae bacterium]
MKITALVLAALAIGIAAGMYASYREFDGERLPTKMTLAILAERENVGGASEGPKVVVEGGEIHDFGTMDRGSKGHHEFVFRNTGNQPLVITLTDFTCRCTAAAAEGKSMTKGDKQTIPPGGSFPLTLEWSINLVDKSFSQSAEFATTDPRREIVRLLIHGRTVDAIELEEQSLSISGVSANEPAVGELSIYSHRDEELKIVQHSWQDTDSAKFLEATFSPLPLEEAVRFGARGGVKMRVAIKPGLPLGLTGQAISVKTNYEGIEPQIIPVEIRIVGDIILLSPKVPSGGTSIVLGAVDQKTGASHTAYLHIKGPHREMTRVEIEKLQPDFLQVTLEEPVAISPTVKRIPIRIDIPAGAPLGSYLKSAESKAGQITLKTTHPQIKQVVISVSFMVR